MFLSQNVEGASGDKRSETSNESVDFQTVNQLIKKHGHDPDYRVKSKISKFHGYSVDQLKKAGDERRGTAG